jgi:hypothetical protein
MQSVLIRPYAGDIGEEQETIIFEPLPTEAPIEVPLPTEVPQEVPA